MLADARITGYRFVGGIVSENDGTVSGCTVKSDVTIFATRVGYYHHGGIVGYNKGDGTVSGCSSSARVTANDNINVSDYGGIVGENHGTIQNCTAAGVVIANVTDAGAIVGSNDGTLSGNTYHSSLVGTNAFNIGVGKYSTGVTTYTYGDQTGATLDDSKLWLFDNRDNTAIIAAYTNPSQHVALHGYYPDANKSYTVTLADRTLYKDGDWNTLCLPFDLDASQVTALLGSNGTLMEIDTDGNHSGHQTGLAADGTLYLYFKNATTIEAGQPYIIKWGNTEGTAVGAGPVPALSELKNPTFTGVTVSNSPAATVTAANSGYQTVEFRGTYSPVTLAANDQSNLYLGSGSTLYWPNASMAIGAFRAYFHVDLTGSVNAVRTFHLGFGDGAEETGIVSTTNYTNYTNYTNGADAWYTLDGRKLDGQPTKKGVYIHGGKKIVVE